MKKQLETELLGFMQDKDMHALLSDMEEGLQRVADVVKNMSVLAWCNNDQTQYININRCIESVCRMLNKQVSEYAELSLDLQDMPAVEINVGEINQVITNLLINASQSMQTYGHIKVRSTLQGKEIIVSVSDNGCGIEKAALNKVFDPFYTTKKEGEGTGLGLAISDDIVQEHGGRLSVISELGKGTVFTVTLPVKTVVIH